MKRPFLVLSLMMLASAATFAQPIGLKDFALGGDLRSEARRAGLECWKSDTLGEACDQWDRSKLADISKTIAGVVAKKVIIGGFDGKLGLVTYYVFSHDFPAVRTSFAEKYPSMTCKDSMVQNRVGAVFEQTTCVVDSAEGRLTLKRRSSDLTEGSIELRSTEFASRAEAASKARAHEGKKDI